MGAKRRGGSERWTRGSRSSLAAPLGAIALAALAAGCSGGRHQSLTNTTPIGRNAVFVRAMHNEASGGGTWKGVRGLFPPYQPGATAAVLFAVHNASGHGVALVGADPDVWPGGVLRSVGVRFALAPRPPQGDAPVEGLHLPVGALPPPTPVRIPSGRDAWIQLNFRQRPCSAGLPARQTSNRHIRLRYRIGAQNGAVTVDLLSDQLIITAPPCASP
jgi:hypothetical protein